MDLRHAHTTRYVLPLREGGSLPALVEADDDFKYVLKFKGSGHKERSVIAELLGGEIARRLGFKVPELVFLHLDEAFGRTEGDEEIQDLLKWSQGTNLGLHFLSGAVNYDPNVMEVDSELASKILWLDAYITNVDRTVKNTNMLMWHRELWLIDHGSSFYFHHHFKDIAKQAKTPFPYIKDHVFLAKATGLQRIDEEFKALLTNAFIDDLVATLPLEWLEWDPDRTPEELRQVYRDFLRIRRDHSEIFIKEIHHARENLV